MRNMKIIDIKIIDIKYRDGGITRLLQQCEKAKEISVMKTTETIIAAQIRVNENTADK